jgi:CO dehydrogenase nickel-insertion accessory protein CooC1
MARNLLEIQDVALKVAVAGEGGVERSTLAGTLARLHAADHLKALAIDADPGREFRIGSWFRCGVARLCPILDMKAGTEHLSRGTAMEVDLMLAVHKPGERSVETAQRVRKRSVNLGIRRFAMMLSR